MNVTELREVLEERSEATPAEVMHHLRLAGVRARIRARRRRRVAAWAAAAAVAIAGVTSVAFAPDRGGDGSTVDPAATIEGFPVYANGTHVIAAERTRLPDTRLELTFIPAIDDLTVFIDCVGADLEKFNVEVRFQGEQMSMGCGGSFTPANWLQRGLRVDEPNVLVMNVVAGANTAADYGIAIGEAVPFEDYPLPPRPATLKPLNGPLPAGCTEVTCPDAFIIRSDPADPLAPRQMTVPWQTIRSVELLAQTPGFLHVTANGDPLGTAKSWDYEQGGHGLSMVPLKRAATVTIEVRPEHVTGAWQAVFQPEP
jgi:hypothetical protein